MLSLSTTSHEDAQRVERCLLGLVRHFHHQYDSNDSTNLCLRDIDGTTRLAYCSNFRLRQMLIDGLICRKSDGTHTICKAAQMHDLYSDARVRLILVQSLRRGENIRFLRKTYRMVENHILSNGWFPICVFQKLISMRVDCIDSEHLDDLHHFLCFLLSLKTTRHRTEDDHGARMCFVRRVFGPRTTLDHYLHALRESLRQCLLGSRPRDACEIVQNAPYIEDALSESHTTVMDFVHTSLYYQWYSVISYMANYLRVRRMFRSELHIRGTDALNSGGLKSNLTSFLLHRELGSRSTMPKHQRTLRRMLSSILQGTWHEIIKLDNHIITDDTLVSDSLVTIKSRSLEESFRVLKRSFDIPNAYMRMMRRVANEDLQKTSGAYSSDQIDQPSMCPDFGEDTQSAVESEKSCSSDESNSNEDQVVGPSPVDLCPARTLSPHNQRGRIILNDSQLQAFRQRDNLDTRSMWVGLSLQEESAEQYCRLFN